MSPPQTVGEEMCEKFTTNGLGGEKSRFIPQKKRFPFWEKGGFPQPSLKCAPIKELKKKG